MLFGAHVSIAGGVENAPERAHAVGSEVFQMFSRSPRGGAKQEITTKVAKKFKVEMKKYKLEECYIHAPYFINYGSSQKRIYHGSISLIRDDLERGSKLGATYVMAHLGSAKDLGDKKTNLQVIKGLKKTLKDYKGSTKLLIEISAGAGKIIGANFQDVGKILKGLSSDVGVCFDTAHAFASGYDLRTKLAVNKTFEEFDKHIGLDKLKLFHANDSKSDFESHVDRHEHIGKGKIGTECFESIINHPKLKKINMIIETPKGDSDKYDKMNLKVLKKLRDKR